MFKYLGTQSTQFLKKVSVAVVLTILPYSTSTTAQENSYRNLCHRKNVIKSTDKRITKWVLPNGVQTYRFKKPLPSAVTEWEKSAISHSLMRLNLISLPGTVCDFGSKKVYQPIFDALNLGLNPSIKNYIESVERVGWTTMGRDALRFHTSHNFEIKLFPPIRLDLAFPKKYETSEVHPTATLLKVPNRLSKEILLDESIPENDREDTFFWVKVKKSSLPIFITEGVKKAASILSSGRVAIGPPGTCRSIFRSDSTDVNHRFEVSTEIKQFIDKSNKRLFYIVFDRDHDPVLHEFVKSNAKVLAQMLTELNMDVKIIDLPEDTKGVDDYIYKYGQNAFNHTLVKDAKNYIDWLELNSNLLSADQIAKNEWCFNPCQGSCALKTKLEEK